MLIKVFPDRFVYAFDNKFVCYNYKKETVEKFNLKSTDNIKSVDGRITSVFYHAATGKLWIGTFDHGVYLYDVNGDDIVPLRIPTRLFENTPVRAFCPMGDDRMMIGLDGLGIFIVDSEDFTLKEVLRENEDDPVSLSGNGVYDIIVDRDGAAWVGTYSGGISIIEDKSLRFHIISHEKNNPNTLRNDIVNSILEDRRSNMWFATNNGISHWARKTGKWTHLLSGNSEIPNTFLALEEDARGNIWAGTYSQGIFVFAPDLTLLKHFRSHPDDSLSLGSDYVFSIYRDKDDVIWIAGRDGQVSSTSTLKGVFEQYGTLSVNSMCQIGDELYFGCINGLYRLDRASRRFIQVVKDVFIHSLSPSIEGDKIWIASKGDGLMSYDPSDDTVVKYGVEDGLPSGYLYAIAIIGNHLWVSSEKGIFRFNSDEKSVFGFRMSDGLSDDCYNQNSVEVSSAGELFFGSYKGVTYFKANDVQFESTNAKIYIDRFKLFNKDISSESEDSPLDIALDDCSELKLKYFQNSFSFVFGSITGIDAPRVKFSWFMEGIDNNWTQPSFDGVANYTKLSPGSYTLHVKAIDAVQNEQVDERSIVIIIRPPLWATNIAFILYAILLVSLILFVANYIYIRLKNRSSIEKIRFFANTAHDLKTPLSLIQTPLKELYDDTTLSERGRYYLGLSLKNIDKLNNIIEQLMLFQKIDKGYANLNATCENVVLLVKRKVDYYIQLAQAKDIVITFHCDSESIYANIDIIKFNNILDNLLSNALKYTFESGHVEVSLNTVGSHQWRLSVKDTGIGIPKDQQKNLFQYFFRAQNAINSKIAGSGIGLLLVKSYVELHGGKVKVESEENRGAEFIITMPVCRHDVVTDSTMEDAVKTQAKTESVRSVDSVDEVEKEGLIQDSQSATKHIKILVVEDNDDLRDYIRVSLSRYYMVDAVEDGKSVAAKIGKFVPDVILSDVRMPGMSGLELAKSLKEDFATSHIPIILISALSERDQVMQGLELGVDDYITKPFDMTILITKINNLIRNRQYVLKHFLGEKSDDSMKSEKNIDKCLNNQSERDSRFLLNAIDIAEKHIMDSTFSIFDFAKEIGVSKTLLYDKLKALIGQTPNDLLRTTRMRKAAELLQENKYSIVEIAHITGFEDAKYFSTCFKKHFGVSPSRYISNNGK